MMDGKGIVDQNLKRLNVHRGKRLMLLMFATIFLRQTS